MREKRPTSWSPSAHTPLSLCFPTHRPPSSHAEERASAVGCSHTCPRVGQPSSELSRRLTAPLADKRLSRSPHGTWYSGISRSKSMLLLHQTFQRERSCSMRNHAHHLFPHWAVVRRLPTDLPHPHQRKLPVGFSSEYYWLQLRDSEIWHALGFWQQQCAQLRTKKLILKKENK